MTRKSATPAKPAGHAKAAAKKTAPKTKARGKGKTATKSKAKTMAAENKAPVISSKPEGYVFGRPTKYRPEFATQAEKLCALGATDADLADFFEVNVRTIWDWSCQREDFSLALRAGKDALDERVERSLYQRAVGYTFDSVKIFMPAGAKEPIHAPYREHIPPDPGAAKLWLCNRRPEKWRDRKELTGADGTPLVPVLNVTYGDGGSSSQSQSAS